MDQAHTSPTQQPRPAMLAVKETSRLCNMHENSLRRLVRQGKFPLQPIRIGGRIFFSRREVERLIGEA